ncbi:hypothetical protein LCGC14_3134050 [marine sediment metagenome]|uniref:Ryanodine receptor Ryr domain-containing protein n=1 Tax=marine sediment metagenome TaxID=412755 RepID=A0A0F8VYV1_9ZZZZ
MPDIKTIAIENIARVTHETNRAYCLTLGDSSQDPWDNAPDWQRESAIEGVFAIVDGDVTKPEESHESWMAQKVKDGWIYGVQKNPATKTHPCMVPYDELPPEQKVKDSLFFAVVNALKDAA